MRERIGLLGGSFNPIHFGHLEMAKAAQRALSLDRLIILPDGDPPHKAKGLAAKEDRLQMARLAAGDQFEVSSMEVDRPGKTYTVDTLEAILAESPETEVWMIMGADTLYDTPTWRRYPRVYELCRFAVFGRAGIPRQAVEDARVTWLDAEIKGLSATEIRRRVHEGKSIRGLTADAVIDYIGKKRLYDPPERMRRKEIVKRLRRDLPNGRFHHVMGVEETIKKLAERWGYDVKRARLAGLLHDCAKGMGLAEMQAFVDKMGEPVELARRGLPQLLHAPASATMARAVYGITDPDILRAIWYHNTGNTTPGLLDKLLWVADISEPGRKALEDVEAIRKVSCKDLDEAVRLTLGRKLAFVKMHGQGLHPDTVAALEALRESGRDS